MKGWLNQFFRLDENQTTVRVEILGGITTFMTMSYIIFFQPAVLSAAGMDRGAVMVATCLSAALATLLMGLLARYPIALAPAVGHNVFFAVVVCGTMGYSWQVALGAVFISGSVFISYSLLKLVTGKGRQVHWLIYVFSVLFIIKYNQLSQSHDAQATKPYRGWNILRVFQKFP